MRENESPNLLLHIPWSSVVKIHITAAFCCANSAGICHWDTITNCSWKCFINSLSARTSHQEEIIAHSWQVEKKVGLAEKKPVTVLGPKFSILCINLYNSLPYFSSASRHGARHGLLLGSRVRIRALFVELWVLAVDAGRSRLSGAGDRAHSKRTEQPVQFTACLIKVKGGWWQVKVTGQAVKRDGEPQTCHLFRHLCYQGRNICQTVPILVPCPSCASQYR